MPLVALKDCTTAVEDAKLLYAKDYMALVSSGMGKVDSVPYGAWPPGQRPEPYKWTDPRTGDTWTLTSLDLAWRYRNSRTKDFISPSALYDLMGIKKYAENGAIVPGQVIPGEHHDTGEPKSNWSNWTIGGLGAGWAILGGIGIYALVKAYKKRGR